MNRKSINKMIKAVEKGRITTEQLKQTKEFKAMVTELRNAGQKNGRYPNRHYSEEYFETPWQREDAKNYHETVGDLNVDGLPIPPMPTYMVIYTLVGNAARLEREKELSKKRHERMLKNNNMPF